MPLFIATNLIISLMQQTASPYLQWLLTAFFLYSGIGLTGLSLLFAASNKISYKIWYDLFAVGAVLIWFTDWHSEYSNQAPMFYYFPLFFCFFAAFARIFFINQRHRIDADSIAYMQVLANTGWLHAGVLMCLVLLSLLLKTHFLLFPIAIILFILRYTLARCLDRH